MNGRRIIHIPISFVTILFMITLFTLPESAKVHGNIFPHISQEVNQTVRKYVERERWHFTPPASVNVRHNIIADNLSDFNHTLREHMERTRWLDQVRQRLSQTDHSEPRLLGNQSHTREAQPSRSDIWPVDRSKDIVISMDSLIRSQGSENNVLKFNFNRSTLKNDVLVTRINLYVYVWLKERKPKSSSSRSPSTRDIKASNRRRNRKGKELKIRVFLANDSGSRGQRIAELKKKINNSTWERLGLPVSLMRNISSSEGNNTLRLRIQCKKCNRRTQLILPDDGSKLCRRKIRKRTLRSKKRKDRREKRRKNAAAKAEKRRRRRWRKNCPQTRAGLDLNRKPFIVIEKKTKHGRQRYKRSLGSESEKPSRHEPVKNTADSRRNSSHEVAQCCKPSKTYIDFSDLNLQDVIVSPTGFDYLICTGTVSESRASVLQRLKNKLLKFLKILSTEGDSPSRPLLASHTVTSSQPPLHRHHSQQHHQHQNHDHWHNHKWSRLKVRRFCQPVKSTKLVILHFNHDQNLVQSEIPNFLITKCGCKSDLTPNRE